LKVDDGVQVALAVVPTLVEPMSRVPPRAVGVPPVW